MEISHNTIPEVLVEILEQLRSVQNTLNDLHISKSSTDSELLSVTQASEFLMIAISTIYSKVSKKEIPFLKRGKHLYFIKADLLKWLEEGKEGKIISLSKQVDTYLLTHNFKKNAA